MAGSLVKIDDEQFHQSNSQVYITGIDSTLMFILLTFNMLVQINVIKTLYFRFKAKLLLVHLIQQSI